LRLRQIFETVGLIAVIASAAEAQNAAEPHRWAGGISFDLGSVPDQFGQRCGHEDGSVVYGGGLTVVHRPRRRMVAVFDARASNVVKFGSCRYAVAPAVPIGPNEFENRPTVAYPRGTPAAPLRRTSVRIGVEVPPGLGMLRATIGGGWIWSGARRPFATGVLEFGTANAGLRLVAGLERSIVWVRQGLEYSRYRQVGDEVTRLPSRFDLHTAAKHWTIARLGIELPL
jgi:hypothetical protein